MASFTIVGTGTGTGQYIIPEAKQVIQGADVLIGGERNLAPWLGHTRKKYYVIKSPLIDVIKWIKKHYHQEKVVVLVSGDPGFYSLLTFLANYFPREEIQVIPGISSMQVAFARLSLPWHDAVLLNLHGRSLHTLDKYIHFPKMALLTDPINNPEKICNYLLSKGRNYGLIHICTNLGYPDENIKTLRLNEVFSLSDDNKDPTVMVILDE
ncbi:MAG: cobalt-precorrin-7 (C5)-methyltransferase [Clostridia bacterium]|nr:cobalt-precorrin-7 (C5)-methyltransferase [Clostridia bacterium]